MTTHWIISIGKPKLPVIAGKAMFTAVSSGTTDVPSPTSRMRNLCRAVILPQAERGLASRSASSFQYGKPN